MFVGTDADRSSSWPGIAASPTNDWIGTVIPIAVGPGRLPPDAPLAMRPSSRPKKMSERRCPMLRGSWAPSWRAILLITAPTSAVSVLLPSPVTHPVPSEPARCSRPSGHRVLVAAMNSPGSVRDEPVEPRPQLLGGLGRRDRCQRVVELDPRLALGQAGGGMVDRGGLELIDLPGSPQWPHLRQPGANASGAADVTLHDGGRGAQRQPDLICCIAGRQRGVATRPTESSSWLRRRSTNSTAGAAS